MAITRARQEMVVVCSIDPGLIKETSKNLGPRRLRQFLEYARASSQLNKEGVNEVLSKLNEHMAVSDKTTLEFDSPFETQVYKALSRHGYTVHTQIGASDYKIDLAVVHPDDPYRYVLAIECDGATFHSSQSAKERDVLRQKFLEDKGWKFERIWSRNWWRNSEEEITRIISRIKKELDSQPSSITESVSESNYQVEPKTDSEEPMFKKWSREREPQKEIETLDDYDSDDIVEKSQPKKKDNLIDKANKIKEELNELKIKKQILAQPKIQNNDTVIDTTEIDQFIASKNMSPKTIQSQTSVLVNFTKLQKQFPDESTQQIFDRFMDGKSSSSISFSKSVIGGFLNYQNNSIDYISDDSLSKEQAKKELSELQVKLVNKYITKDEYKKRRDELEDILFD